MISVEFYDEDIEIIHKFCKFELVNIVQFKYLNSNSCKDLSCGCTFY